MKIGLVGLLRPKRRKNERHTDHPDDDSVYDSCELMSAESFPLTPLSECKILQLTTDGTTTGAMLVDESLLQRKQSAVDDHREQESCNRGDDSRIQKIIGIVGRVEDRNDTPCYEETNQPCSNDNVVWEDRDAAQGQQEMPVDDSERDPVDPVASYPEPDRSGSSERENSPPFDDCASIAESDEALNGDSFEEDELMDKAEDEVEFSSSIQRPGPLSEVALKQKLLDIEFSLACQSFSRKLVPNRSLSGEDLQDSKVLPRANFLPPLILSSRSLKVSPATRICVVSEEESKSIACTEQSLEQKEKSTSSPSIGGKIHKWDTWAARHSGDETAKVQIGTRGVPVRRMKPMKRPTNSTLYNKAKDFRPGLNSVDESETLKDQLFSVQPKVTRTYSQREDVLAAKRSTQLADRERFVSDQITI